MPLVLTKNIPFRVADPDALLAGRVRSGSSGTFIDIVPTKRKIRALQREFLGLSPGGVSPAFHLFTLETLALDLHSLICPSKRFLSGPSQAVLINEAIVSAGDSLQYFPLRSGGARLPKGTFQKIVDVLRILKDNGISPALLRAELESAGSEETAKLQDILRIYEAYEERLGERFTDSGGVFRDLALRWEPVTSAAAFRNSYPAADLLVVPGFDAFSDPELTLIHNVSDIPGMGTVVSFDYQPENPEAFGHLRESYRKLVEMGFAISSASAWPAGGFGDHVSRHLFQVRPPRYRAGTPQVTIAAAPDREKEVELIARIIKHAVALKPDRSLDSICVALARPQRYASLFRDVFERYGIPANITDRYPLDQSPVIVALMALLSVQKDNFRVDDVLRAATSPFLSLSGALGPVSPGNLTGAFALVKTQSGISTILRRIAQRRSVIGAERSEGEEGDGRRLDEEDRMLEKAHADLVGIQKLLEPLGGPMTPQEFGARMRALIREAGIAGRLAAVPAEILSEEDLEKEVRAFQKFGDFLDEFLEIIESAAGGPRREPLAFYLDQLRAALPQVRYNIRQKYGYGVTVTSPEETRGLKFDVMIIAGMVDGELPPAGEPEIFLSSDRRAERERLHRLGSRYLFYQTITNFTDHCYLTFPRCEGDVLLVPSSFLDAVSAVVDIEDWRESVPDGLANGLYSRGEALRRAGDSLGRGEPGDEGTTDEILNTALGTMRRAVAVERERISGGGGEYGGRIGAALGVHARSELLRLKDRVYSVTQLESFGRCPFQFFADRILRLRPPVEAEEGISAAERGALLHEILFEFYTERRERRAAPVSRVADPEFREALNDLLAIARRKLSVFEGLDVYWDIDRDLLLGEGGGPGVLGDFLQKERDDRVSVEPAFFEVAFGTGPGKRKNADERLRHADPVIAGNIRLRGKIDRIDSGNGLFRIIDYKTGSTIARMDEIELGMSLQLPLYLYAVEKILSERSDMPWRGVAGVYYHVKDPVEQKLGLGSAEHLGGVFNASPRQRQLLPTDAELRNVIDRAIVFINDYIDAISRGEFPVEPKAPDKTCRHCSFRTICRIQSKISGAADGEGDR